MALVKTTLETAILAALTSNSNIAIDPDGDPAINAQKSSDAREDIATQLADAIFDFVSSGEVITEVNGTSVSGGPVTGVGTANVI